jgi:hypothetical protein
LQFGVTCIGKKSAPGTGAVVVVGGVVVVVVVVVLAGATLSVEEPAVVVVVRTVVVEVPAASQEAGALIVVGGVVMRTAAAFADAALAIDPASSASAERPMFTPMTSTAAAEISATQRRVQLFFGCDMAEP